MTGPDPQVLVVGAGPVGLLLGNLLGTCGVHALVIDKRARGPEASMAIGLTPPSLALLQTLQLDQSFIATGVRVEQAVVHGDRGTLGTLSFRTLSGRYPFILALPQAKTASLLEIRLRDCPRVELRRGVELVGLEQDVDGVTAVLREGDAALAHPVRCAFLIGADGGYSRVRQLAAIAADTGSYPQNFAMADFADHSDLGDQAHLFFTRHGSVESFPLPMGRRRWVVQTGERLDPIPTGFLAETVRRRTGIDLNGCEPFFSSSYGVGWLLARRYHRGRIVLCGDAAHLMSPVGGQGMNVGFADAAWLAALLSACCREGAAAEPLLAGYEQARRKTARIAIGRAARGMWLGTRQGRLAGLWREPLLRLLLAPPLRERLPPYFAMLTLPHPLPPNGCSWQ
ncbi:MAG: FAD-dependent monooxygenase [Desulfuromonas sp.]|nr:FAD-dependent monooxygenase [Desulfuromonas sp.]